MAVPHADTAPARPPRKACILTGAPPPYPTPVYFDHAATSWPKPAVVNQAVVDYMASGGSGHGRSVGRAADALRDTLAGLRRDLATLIGAADHEIVFAHSATDALNLIIHGLMLHRFGNRSGEPLAVTNHRRAEPALVVTTQIEHNSVLRPLHAWVRRGWIRLEILPCDTSGTVQWSALEHLWEQRPWLVCATHASNVTGTVQDLESVGAQCRGAGALFLVDAAQTLGCLPVDVQRLACDFLVAPGHKSLAGPLGTGVAFLGQHLHDQVDSIRLGGTGGVLGQWDADIPPPQKWEAGNWNVPGLVGLAAALRSRRPDGHAESVLAQPAPVDNKTKTINKLKQANATDMPNQPVGSTALLTADDPWALAAQLWEGLGRLPEIQRRGAIEEQPYQDRRRRLPITSFTAGDWEPAALAVALESAGGFVTRAGYHCAPLIHAALGTTDQGTLRVSFGPGNTAQQVEQFLQTLEAVCQF